MTGLLSLALLPGLSNAASMPRPGGPKTETVNSPGAQVLISRLEAIKAMDKSGLGFSEKRQLRKEVRGIKSTLARDYGGVYISVGSLLIVIILLILLL